MEFLHSPTFVIQPIYSLAMVPFVSFVTLLTLLTLGLWSHQATAAPTSITPSDFPGDESPYRVVPEDGDAPTTSDVAGLNVLGTWLYGYTECRKRFGPGAGGIIDSAYYSAWLISR
jgi:hypothetical protein